MSEDIKIKENTRSLAGRIKPLLSVKDNGELVDDKVFEKIATEDGRNLKQMIDDDNYRSNFVSAHTLASGEVALDFMKKNKKVENVAGSFEIGRSTLEVKFDRHKKVPNRVMDKETGNFKVDGEKDLYGDSAVKFAVYGARGSRGELKQVREFLQDNFKSAFSK